MFNNDKHCINDLILTISVFIEINIIINSIIRHLHSSTLILIIFYKLFLNCIF